MRSDTVLFDPASCSSGMWMYRADLYVGRCGLFVVEVQDGETESECYCRYGAGFMVVGENMKLKSIKC